jgi:predicted ATPase with chaperone activity
VEPVAAARDELDPEEERYDAPPGGSRAARASKGVWRSVPPQPHSLPATGLSPAFLDDLILKILRTHDRPRVVDVAHASALHPQVVADILEALLRRRQAEVQSADSTLPAHFRYQLSEAGKAAADDSLRRCSYVGPAPVPIEAYSAAVLRQSGGRPKPSPAQIEEALDHLVLPKATVDAIGQAFLSGRAMMVFGPSGNGKTDIVTSVAACSAGSVLIPHALYAQGQIIEVFDPQFHKPATQKRGSDDSTATLEPMDKRDRRWREIRRPAIVAGGELGMTALEMTFDPGRNIHKAPLSIKAQGGVLVTDDLGRQRLPVETILDRWIDLMERGYETFTLRYGEAVTLPTDVTLVFSTNLSLEDLMDEAYLRRLSYKVHIPNPGREQLTEIARRSCEAADLPYTDKTLTYLISKLFNSGSLEPRGCYPRDVIQTIIDSGRYYDTPPELNVDTIDRACALYFSYRNLVASKKAA